MGVYVHLMIMTGISAAGSPVVCLSSGRIRELVFCVNVCFDDRSFKRSLGCGFCSGRFLPPFLPSPYSRDPSKMLDLLRFGKKCFHQLLLIPFSPRWKFYFFCDFSLYVLAAHLDLYKTFLELSVLSWKLMWHLWSQNTLFVCTFLFWNALTLEWPCGL